MAKYFQSRIYQLTRDLLALVENGPEGLRVRAGRDPVDAGIILQRLADTLEADAAADVLTRAMPPASERSYRAPGWTAVPAAGGDAEAVPVVDVEIRLPPFNPAPDALKFIDLRGFLDY